MSSDPYDAEAWRKLVVGALDRVEQIARQLRGDGDGDIDWAELGANTKATMDAVLDELGELLSKLLAQVIALLEALQTVLDSSIARRADEARNSPGHRRSDRGGFEPITVHVNVATGRPGG